MNFSGYGKQKAVHVGSDSVSTYLMRNLSMKFFFLSFKILITGGSSGFIETITDAVSIHSIKKAEYDRRISGGRFSHVSLLDYFVSVSNIIIYEKPLV